MSVSLPHVVLVHGEITQPDVDGNPVRVPGPTAVRVRCRVSPLSAEEASLLGQDVTSTARVIAQRWPAGAWSSVEWAGRIWDIVGEPQRHPGATPATAHVSVLIRSRVSERSS